MTTLTDVLFYSSQWIFLILTQVSDELSASPVWPERWAGHRSEKPSRECPSCQLPHRAPTGETWQRRCGHQQWVAHMGARCSFSIPSFCTVLESDYSYLDTFFSSGTIRLSSEGKFHLTLWLFHFTWKRQDCLFCWKWDSWAWITVTVVK